MYHLFELLKAFSYLSPTKDPKLHFRFLIYNTGLCWQNIKMLIGFTKKVLSSKPGFHSSFFRVRVQHTLSINILQIKLCRHQLSKCWFRKLICFSTHFKYVLSLNDWRICCELWRLPLELRTLVKWGTADTGLRIVADSMGIKSVGPKSGPSPAHLSLAIGP